MKRATFRKFVEFAAAVIAVNLLCATADAADVVPAEPRDEEVAETDARAALHRQFLRLLDDENYTGALDAAVQVVNMTKEEFGEQSDRMIGPLINLATTQVEVDEMAAAEENYQAAILLIEKHEDFLSPRMINPLIGLGTVYNRTRRYDQAVVTFERALRVNHVNKGFTNTDQFEIRDGLTESFIGLSENDEANFHQETQLEIHRRRFGTQSAETAGAYKKLGDWYARSGQVDPALETYSRADRIYRNEGSEVLHQRIASLEALAQLYQRTGQLGTSSSVLRKALEIVEAQPERDVRLRSRLLVGLGDLYTIFNKSESAGRRYLEAWTSLSGEDELLDDRDTYFDQPTRVAGLRLTTLSRTATAEDAPRSRVSDGYVLMSYTVTAAGRARDVKILESDPPGLMDRKLESLWKRSKFRARYVDGQPVAAENLLLRHDYKYAVEPKEPEGGDKSSSSKGELGYPDKRDN